MFFMQLKGYLNPEEMIPFLQSISLIGEKTKNNLHNPACPVKRRACLTGVNPVRKLRTKSNLSASFVYPAC
jgi:hypothetical protein